MIFKLFTSGTLHIQHRGDKCKEYRNVNLKTNGEYMFSLLALL